MIVSELEKAVTSVKEEGKCPLAVIATAGTTVLGAFDPITEIAAVCQKHKLWMHIDVSIFVCGFQLQWTFTSLIP